MRLGGMMRPLRTLRARLAAATAASILAAVALFALITVIVVGNQLRGSLDTALRQRAQDVAQLAISAPAVLGDPGALESPSSGRQLVVEVIDARGRILARSLALGALLLPQDALVRDALRHGRAGVQDIRLAGRPLRMFVAPIADATGAASGGAVLVAADTEDISRTLSNLGTVVALSGVGVVLLAALAAALLTRRGLRPLSRLAAAAGEIERTADSTRRLPAAPARDEIGRLTGVLNRMLAVARGLARERAALPRRRVARAAHTGHLAAGQRRVRRPPRRRARGARGAAPGRRAAGAPRRRPARARARRRDRGAGHAGRARAARARGDRRAGSRAGCRGGAAARR